MNAIEKDLLTRLFTSWTEFVDDHCKEQNMDWTEDMRILAQEVNMHLALPVNTIDANARWWEGQQGDIAPHHCKHCGETIPGWAQEYHADHCKMRTP